MQIICGIYKICSPTGRIYIGQSINILKRFRAYKSIACREQTLLARSFKKYGVESHKFDIIHECIPQELNELEIYYIGFYNSFNSKNGLNLKAGGQNGGVCSEEVRQKMRKPKSDEAKESYRISALNRPAVSEETRDKHRQRMLGNSHVKGKNWTKASLSEETKNKIRQKLSKTNMGDNNPNSKARKLLKNKTQ